MNLSTLVQEYIAAFFELHPGLATERGYPDRDAELPVYDEAALARFQSRAAVVKRSLAEIDPRTGKNERDTDHALLESHIDLVDLLLVELDWLHTNPLFHVQALFDSLHNLETRHDLDAGERARCLRSRLEQFPRWLASFRNVLTAPMAPYFEMAVEVLEAGGEYLESRFTEDARTGEGRDAVARARQVSAEALTFLRSFGDRVQPFRPMGERLYRLLLQREHQISDTLDELKAIAHRVLEHVEGDDDFKTESTEKAPADFNREAVLRYYDEELAHLRSFVEAKRLVTIPPGEIQVRETPSYLAPIIPGASYHPPPLMVRGEIPLVGHLYISPIPERMNASQRGHYHHIVKHRLRRNLLAHEVYPGHHVQFLHAAQLRRPMRNYRDNDVMVEGWAFYCETLMREQGLYDEVPSPRPRAAERFRATRVLLDIGIHTGELSLDGAVQVLAKHFKVKTADWMRSEIHRYAAEPTQALSYLIGREQILALREEMREALGAAFSLFDFHNQLLAEGSIPVPLIRRKLLSRKNLKQSTDRAAGPVGSDGAAV